MLGVGSESMDEQDCEQGVVSPSTTNPVHGIQFQSSCVDALFSRGVENLEGFELGGLVCPTARR